MHLIIDGYNLIRQSLDLQCLEARELEAGREALLERLADYRSHSPLATQELIVGAWFQTHPHVWRR